MLHIVVRRSAYVHRRLPIAPEIARHAFCARRATAMHHRHVVDINRVGISESQSCEVGIHTHAAFQSIEDSEVVCAVGCTAEET